MAKFKFELNYRGVRDLMKSDSMLAVCREHAEATASAAGDGYEVTDGFWPTRRVVTVRAETEAARKDNYENNTLLKALR